MAQRLELQIVSKDGYGRTYAFNKESILTIRAFDNSMAESTTFRVFHMGKEITLRDLDYPARLSGNEEKLIAEALHFTYKLMIQKGL